MKKNLPLSLISSTCRYLLIVMWTYAAFSKLFNYEKTRFDWLGHELIKNYTGLLAWLIPVIELVIVVLLLFPRTVLKGFYASIVLLIIFSSYIIYMFLYYPHTPCSCGGIISSLTWQQHVIFNLSFLVVAILGIIASKKNLFDSIKEVIHDS